MLAIHEGPWFLDARSPKALVINQLAQQLNHFVIRRAKQFRQSLFPISINSFVIHGHNRHAFRHKLEHGFLEANFGADDFNVNGTTMGGGAGAPMSSLSIATASGATDAKTTLDKAINHVNEIRGDLGAIQNCLEYTINNLSLISNATAGARGRILDADFAQETSELTKLQILTQAATSIIAQANQSKQADIHVRPDSH